MRGEADRFLLAEREDAEHGQALVEQPVHVLLQRLGEVDHHVAAGDHVKLVERGVGGEVVLREDDLVHERPGEARSVVARDVVLGERARPAGADVVLRVLLHLVEREDAEPGDVDHGLVDVGRVDAHAIREALLGEQDRERVDLLAGRAAGDPEPGEGIAPERRDDLLAEGDVEGWIAEHRGHVDREVEQEPFHHGGVVQDQILERGDRLHLLPVHPTAQPPLQRRRRVLAEVEAVAAVDRFQEELELELLELELLASLYW